MTEFLFIFFQLFSQWGHLKVSPRLNTRTGVQYWRWVQWSQKSHLPHFTNTTLVLFWSSFVCQSWQKTAFFFLCNAVSIACFWPLILWQERNWSTFSIDSRRAWAFFFHDFFFSLFAGLLDSAAALDTGTFFCCFASMEFRMLMLVLLVKFPDRNGGKNIF